MGLLCVGVTGFFVCVGITVGLFMCWGNCGVVHVLR